FFLGPRHFPDFYVQLDGLAFAPYFHVGTAIGLGSTHNARQIGHVLDLFAIEFDDDIARPYARLVGWTVFFDIADHGTLGFSKPDSLGNVIGHRADLYANPATGNLAVLLELLDHTHGFINRNGQRNPHEATALRNDLGIDTNHLSSQIDQRTTRVTGIDGYV